MAALPLALEPFHSVVASSNACAEARTGSLEPFYRREIAGFGSVMDRILITNPGWGGH